MEIRGPRPYRIFVLRITAMVRVHPILFGQATRQALQLRWLASDCFRFKIQWRAERWQLLSMGNTVFISTKRVGMHQRQTDLTQDRRKDRAWSWRCCPQRASTTRYQAMAMSTAMFFMPRVPGTAMALSRAMVSNCAPLPSIFCATIAPLLLANATPRPE